MNAYRTKASRVDAIDFDAYSEPLRNWATGVETLTNV
jgi:hypothetical protein